MQAVHGYFKDGRFISSEMESIPENRNVIVVVLDERSPSSDNANVWRDFLERLESIDEENSAEFERASLHRKVEI